MKPRELYKDYCERVSNPKSYAAFYMSVIKRWVSLDYYINKRHYIYKDNKKKKWSQRIIWVNDWYYVIYKRITSPEKLFYFLERNKGKIKSRYLDESKMFDNKDLEYLHKIAKSV